MIIFLKVNNFRNINVKTYLKQHFKLMHTYCFFLKQKKVIITVARLNYFFFILVNEFKLTTKNQINVNN